MLFGAVRMSGRRPPHDLNETFRKYAMADWLLVTEFSWFGDFAKIIH
jgi:hypothetical protein